MSQRQKCQNESGKEVNRLKPLLYAKTIKGYIRKDGSVGFRNYVLILPSVICSSRLERIASSGTWPQSPGTTGLAQLEDSPDPKR